MDPRSLNFFQINSANKDSIRWDQKTASILCFHLSFSLVFSNSFNTKPGPIIYFNEYYSHNDDGGDGGPSMNTDKTHLRLAIVFA